MSSTESKLKWSLRLAAQNICKFFHIRFFFANCSSFKGLTLHYMNQHVIVPHDYLKLLIKFDPRKLQEYNGFFNVKFGTCRYQGTAQPNPVQLMAHL